MILCATAGKTSLILVYMKNFFNVVMYRYVCGNYGNPARAVVEITEISRINSCGNRKEIIGKHTDVRGIRSWFTVIKKKGEKRWD